MLHISIKEEGTRKRGQGRGYKEEETRKRGHGGGDKEEGTRKRGQGNNDYYDDDSADDCIHIKY